MDGASGFGYGVFVDDEKKASFYQDAPLTELERILLDNRDFEAQKHIWEQPKKGFTNVSYEMIGCSTNGFFPNFQKSSIDGGFLAETNGAISGSGERTRERNPAVKKNNARVNVKASTVVKGQWTLEEDKLLVRLVQQYGIRKWSQVAQMFPGRIGKQCRERWHNHLRPDIKKDTWSIEEEIMLVEAHEKIGNKWAEIAKKIPGRTENSIKNHWNATRRKQNSKRKIRKSMNHGANSRSSILLDYIKKLNLKENSMTKSVQSPVPVKIQQDSNVDHNKKATQEFFIPDSIPTTIDDHLIFSQFYKENPFTSIPSMNNLAMGSPDEEEFYVGQLQYPIFSDDLAELEDTKDCSSFFSSSSVVQNTDRLYENETSSHLYSDLYLSHLLEGTSIFTSAEKEEGTNPQQLHLDQASSKFIEESKQDMDLMELVSASFQISKSSS